MTAVLCIGDPHFKVDELDELDSYIEEIKNAIITTNPDFCVMLGDLLHDHEKINTLALNKACNFVTEMAKLAETFLIVGNHDMINASQFLTDNHWMNPLKAFPNVTVVDKLVRYKDFLFLPFVPNSRFKEALKDTDLSNVKCIFAHQEFKGCKMGAIISEEGDEWDLKNPLVVTGHIHDKQQPQENIIYVGSSRQHSFAEKADKSISLFKFFQDSSLYIREEIFLKLPKKKIKYLTISQIYKFESKFEGKLKLCIKCTQEEFKMFRKSDKYKELTLQGIKIEYKKDKKEDIIKDTKLKQRTNFFDVLTELIKDDEELNTLFKKYIK